MNAQRRFTLFLACMVFASLAPRIGWSQGVQPFEEYAQRIKASQAIASLGPSLFGDEVNEYTGALQFLQTDVSLAGTGALPVAAQRRLTMGNPPQGSWYGEGLFANWDIELPKIHGVFSAGLGWKAHNMTGGGGTGTITGERCTLFGQLPPAQGSDVMKFVPSEYWHGTSLSVPGAGDQEILLRASGNAKAPGSDPQRYRLVTSNWWTLSCLPAASDGGEGFVAVSPEGTRYVFDQLVSRQYAPRVGFDGGLVVEGGSASVASTAPGGNSTARATGTTTAAGMVSSPREIVPNLPPAPTLQRREYWMLPSRVEDRHGNWVQYRYANVYTGSPASNHGLNWTLTQITASDGRRLDFTYVPGTRRIDTVTVVLPSGAVSRTWRYGYSVRNVSQYELASVTLPDGSAWGFNMQALNRATRVQYSSKPNCGAANFNQTVSYSGTMTHPSGASGQFTVKAQRHGRSYVPKSCWYEFTYGGMLVLIPNVFEVLAIQSKKISGPGLPTAGLTWRYAYGPSNQSWLQDCPNNSCPQSREVSITDPAGQVQRLTFGNRHRVNEAQLLRVDHGWDAATQSALRTETHEYAPVLTTPTAPNPYPALIGYSYVESGDSYLSTLLLPLRRRVTQQQGVSFTWEASAFDEFARPTTVTRSGPGSLPKVEQDTYFDHLPTWTLGQLASREDRSSATARIEIANSYDPQSALLASETRFGQLARRLTYYADGELQSSSDGKGYTTGLSLYKRGIPQRIDYVDGRFESVVVDDEGWIRSHTDPAGSLTAYDYDPSGRLRSIAYPNDSQNTWNTTEQRFVRNAAAEAGLLAGHWKQTLSTGRGYREVWFDALWRPVLTREHDADQIAATQRYTIQGYDAAGRPEYVSYPLSGAPLYTDRPAGTRTRYDALDRITHIEQDSELGVLTTTTAYLSGFSTQVTAPRGFQTLTTYQAWDTPQYNWPRLITHPEGAVTEIARDAFGQPSSVLRRNSAGSDSAIRRFVYNAQQRLCKRIEPESGTTVFEYDAAGNLAWSAAGVNLPAVDTCNLTEAYGSGRRVDRAYDARHRLVTLSFPDGVGNQTWGYTPDGLPEQVRTDNSAGGTPVVNHYDYNARRLLKSETLSQPDTSATTIGYGYDANGHPATLTYPDGLLVDYAPNALGQPSRAGSYASAVRYHPNGSVQHFTYGNGLTHTLSQNLRQLPERRTDSGGALDQQYSYDGHGNVSTITDYAQGAAFNRTLGYDGLDRLTSANAAMFGGDGWHRYSYDALDNLRTATLGGIKNHRYDYDATQRLRNVVNVTTGASVTALSYDLQGNLAGKNGLAHRFDFGNRLREVVGKESYRYDGHGRRVYSRGADGSVRFWQYSSSGQLLRQSDLSGNATQHLYLGATLLAKLEPDTPPLPPTALPAPGGLQASPAPASGTFTASWTAVTGAVRYAFSASNGLSTSAQSVTATSASVTDPDGGAWAIQVRACRDATDASCGALATLTVGVTPKPVASVNVPAGTQSGAYTVTWPPSIGATQYRAEEYRGSGWSLLGLLTQTSLAITPTASGTYRYRITAVNAYGERAGVESATVSVTLGPGTLPAPSVSISPALSTDGNYRLSWSAVTGAALYQVQEQPSGQLWTSTTLFVDFTNRSSGTYTYTVRACASSSSCTGTVSSSVSVQVNRATPPPPTPTNFRYSPLLVSQTKPVNFSWDSAPGASYYELRIQGGCLSAPQIQTIAEVSPPPSIRYSRIFTYCGVGSYQVELRACNAAACSNWTSELYIDVAPPLRAAAGLQAAATVLTRYYHTDALGSPVAVSNAAGQIIERTNYEPYGAALNKTVNGVGYTGHVMDAATGLTYMQQRYYDPAIGRFLSVDPVAADGNTGADFNRYWYADDNPYALTDPDGQDATLFVRSAGSGATNFGHVALRIHGDGYDKTYDFGRYRNTSGFMKSKGEGILRVWNNAEKFKATQNGKGDLLAKEYKTSKTFDKAVESHFQKQIDAGEKIETTQSRESYKLAGDYDLLENNCTTQSLEGIAAGEAVTGEIIKEIAPHKNENDPRKLHEALKQGDSAR